MRAGGMKYRLTLMKPVAKVNGFGESVMTYEETRMVRAERVKLSGNRGIDADEMFSSYGAEFNIRNSHPVGEGWRAKQLGGNLYTITSILPNLDKGMNTLVCERVNE